MAFRNLEGLEKNPQTEFGVPVKKREKGKYRPPSQQQRLNKIPSPKGPLMLMPKATVITDTGKWKDKLGEMLVKQDRQKSTILICKQLMQVLRKLDTNRKMCKGNETINLHYSCNSHTVNKCPIFCIFMLFWLAISLFKMAPTCSADVQHEKTDVSYGKNACVHPHSAVDRKLDVNEATMYIK